MWSAFNNLCDWLEEEIELYTLGELHERMTKMTDNENEDVCSVKRLKQKLEDRYRGHLFFVEVNGRKNVVCFRDMTSPIINDKWYEAKQDNIEDKSERIVFAAAKIIKAPIREMSYSLDFDPVNDDIHNVDAAC